MTQKEIVHGNAKIKEFLHRWFPNVHGNYIKFNMPFEFHNSIGRQYAVHGCFAPEFKSLALYQKFYEHDLSSIQKFEILLDLVDCYNKMNEINHATAIEHYISVT